MVDIVIRHGKIVDGSGNPWFYGDVAVENGRIVQVGRVDGPARAVFDADGLVVAPGFIDSHSHADFVCAAVPAAESKIMQGVTTEVVGQCGLAQAPVNPKTLADLQAYLAPFIPKGVEPDWSWQSLDDYLRRIESQGNSTNLAFLVGHGTLRLAVMGFEDREPTAAELEKMKALLAESMAAGAWGLSTGLIYPPGCFAETEELVELARVAAAAGGVYASHIRNEGDRLVPAVEEAIRIGEAAKIPVCISHHKAAGRANWGKTKQTLALMEAARRRGVDVTFDVYPYTAGNTLLSALIPGWAQAGSVEQMLQHLKNAESRARIKKDIAEGIPGWENLAKSAGWDNILLGGCTVHKEFEGKTLAEVAALSGKDPADALLDLLLDERGEATISLFTIDEEEMQGLLAHPLAAVGSDGWASAVTGPLAQGKPHPRAFGTFPRVLRRYVRELGLLTLEEAVRKMTSATAQRYGLADRGLLRPGYAADIVAFDPEEIEDTATYENPFRYPKGIHYVLVNGKLSVGEGQLQGVHGTVLRRKQ